MAQIANDAAPAAQMSIIDWVTAACRHVALLAAMIATAGSLFFSEVLGWIPCELCWYQRILMYPLTVILSIGILRGDRKMYLYALPLALAGIGVSLYHYLVVMLIVPPPACTGAIPCAFDYINIPGALSFVKVPFLALTAFSIISVMLGNYALAGDSARDGGRPARIAAIVIVVGTILAFVGLGMAM
jgi:disulfide bond formation protein DsbB